MAKTPIELTNGECIEGSLGLMALKLLKAKDRNLYEKVDRILVEGAKTSEDVVLACWAGYIAISKDEKPLKLNEFSELLPDSLRHIAKILQDMI